MNVSLVDALWKAGAAPLRVCAYEACGAALKEGAAHNAKWCSNACCQRAYRAARQKEGLCGRCGKHPPMNGKLSCVSCSEYGAKRYNANYDGHKTAILDVGFKRCPKCAKDKPIEDFNVNTTREGEVHYTRWCHACLQVSQQNRLISPAKHRIRMLNVAFLARGCAVCHEPADEIDHINPAHKTMELTVINYWAARPDEHLIELGKCQALCIVCHRKKSANERTTGKLQGHIQIRNRMHVQRRKLERQCCNMCKKMVSEENAIGFDWDHVDPTTKLFCVAVCGNRSIVKLDAEIAKCRLLCARCHRQYTKEQRKNRQLPLAKRSKQI